jgi:ElaB/YqjD/DUF883 family membrane-anchored ribosome-binding protein
MAAETPKGKAGNDDLQTQLDALRADLSALAALLQANSQKAAEGLKEKADALTGEARARATAAMGDLRREADRLEDRLETQVREKPLQSLMMAFGLGLLVSILLRR